MPAGRAKEALYDAEKIARFFGVTVKTACEWCHEGKLPAFKIGKEWKVRVSDLQKMIDRKVRSRERDDSPRLF
jgi:excisionase family DNA binding protein